MYYPGNKNIPGLIQKIINQIPPCKNFYEPYAGSAAVSNFLSVSLSSPPLFYINDLDPSVLDINDYPAGAIVTNNQAMQVINLLLSLPADKNTFVFLDPPYMHHTRPHSLHLYKYEMSNDDHKKLLLAVLDLKCNCMIIHPECAFYDLTLSSFRKIKFTVRYHNKTSWEALYMNYPSPEHLLTYDLVGNDCWDRQRIKRKGDRLVKKLLSLPVTERNYILSRLSDFN